MERCPLCRATLNGAETCRRCKAELASVQRVERESRVLAGRAMQCLAVGDAAGSCRLLRSALELHATPEVRTLWQLVRGASRDSQYFRRPRGSEDPELGTDMNSGNPSLHECEG